MLIALLLLIPNTGHNGSDGNTEWLPRLRDPLMWTLGLLLAGTASLFFGTNAYMASVLEDRGELARLDTALFCFNLAQVAASTLMLWMARHWVGRRSPILWTAGLSVAAMLGFILLEGWVGVTFAVLMSFFAGLLLILIVALPPQLVSSSEAGRLSAGNFTIGYILAFVIPLIGGVLADTTGQALAAVGFITLFSASTVPLALRLNLPD